MSIQPSTGAGPEPVAIGRAWTPRGRAFALLAIVGLVAAVVAASQDGSGRDSWQKVDDVFAAMGVRDGSRVADVGAGDGYFTMRLARQVGQKGRVFPVDISERALDRLRANIEREGLSNVEPIHGAADDPKLPDGLDAILVVNAYHEFDDVDGMLRHFRSALRDGGRLVIVEPISQQRRGQARKQQTSSHEIESSYVDAEVRAAGFRVERLEDPFTTRPQRQGRGSEEWLLIAVPQ